MAALARAEVTLLGRSKGTLFAAMFVPLIMPFSVRSAADGMDLEKAGLSIGTVVLPAALGVSLLFAVYTTLSGVYTARREELVLKRLRTGELRDLEILSGSALPAVTTGLVQSVVLAAGCSALLGVEAPAALYYVIPGFLLGVVMCVAFAAVTSSFSRNTESAQVTTMPFMLLSLMGSGLFIPLEVMPDRLASVCELLPLSPVMSLLRGGWSGSLSAGEGLTALVTALAWTAIAVFAVRRWFRWEPRR
ncbi:ABC transporter permease [Streptomyces sp. XM83C]|jgi:ABC-2 type transport system permease protein|uniref:Transport permease protein n=1 Tax=Streptomyces thermocoprophilus TaxID=78356 RepID=A0ABV5VIL6_9ACTN|nr:ABC transporter permease [Streptomyces sp. XM83C]MCK1822737.1 ABC transporter permease [Streptomyces sp. XM83C]